MSTDRIERPPKDKKRAEDVEKCWKLEIGEIMTAETTDPSKWKAYFYSKKAIQSKVPEKRFTISVVQQDLDVDLYTITVKRIEIQ